MINNHRTSSSKMEDIRQILLRNPELPHEENLHYLYQMEFLDNNLTPSSKMEDNHFQNLELEPEELHYLCQETNRPTLGVTWNYLKLVYFNSFIREQPKKYESFWFYLSDNLQEKPELREYASNVELRETVKNQRLFDIARWEHTRHLMTEEDIHINGKRIAMTDREMLYVLKNELDYMMLMTRESRLKLMNDIRQSLKCKSCYEDFRYRFLLNIHPIHLENFNLPCFRCSFQTSRCGTARTELKM